MNQTVAFHVVPKQRTIQCPHCGTAYVPAAASICDCVTEHRSLRCPSCSLCSCTGRAVEIRRRFEAASAEEMIHLRQSRQMDTNLAAVEGTLRRPLVVVADDNFDIRNVVKRVLENLGYGVIAVENGEEAWNAVQEFRPEIALLDGLMPKADGREISKRIKEDPSLDTKTVIMTSLYTSPAQKDEAFREYRVDGYLAKPVKPQVLEDTLAELLVRCSSASPPSNAP